MTMPDRIDKPLADRIMSVSSGGDVDPLASMYDFHPVVDGKKGTKDEQIALRKRLMELSDLSPNLVLHISRAYMVAEMVNSQELMLFVDNVLHSLISKNRAGRVEALEIEVAKMRRESEDYDK